MANRPMPGVDRVRDEPTQTSLRQLWQKVYGLESQGNVPEECTLDPDTKPILQASDKGRKIHATDFNRVFVWTGSAWQDYPPVPPRGQIVYFAEGMDPGPGWVACDGEVQNISTSNATVSKFNPPTLANNAGQTAWMRV